MKPSTQRNSLPLKACWYAHHASSVTDPSGPTSNDTERSTSQRTKMNDPCMPQNNIPDQNWVRNRVTSSPVRIMSAKVSNGWLRRCR